MKLSKYPYLVQKEILDDMNISNLFLLSFLSEKMKILIKSSQAKRFKSISDIIYKSFFKKQFVGALLKTCEEHIMLVFEHREEDNYDFFQLTVSGKMINFRLSEKLDLPVACFHPSDGESVIESIHNYFLSFFGDTVEYQWIASHHEHFIPQLNNFSLSFFPDPRKVTDIKEVEKMFASTPVLKHISLKLDEPFSSDSKFYQAESIRFLIEHSNTVDELLRHFQGKQAVLICNCDISVLIEFMNRWRSGEGSRKLEHLKVKLISDEIPQNEVLNADGVKHIYPTKTPPTHTLPNLFTANMVYKPKTSPIISHTYIVRETDNRVASVSVQGDKFRFGVWKETEEELLRMVK